MTTGFDYLRIALSTAVLAWHSLWISTGDSGDWIWSGPLRCLPAAILPMFFALSGFLVCGSLFRNSLGNFVVLRVIRLFPALTIDIAVSAFVIGLAFTELQRASYLHDEQVWSYLLNIAGVIQFDLPGVFRHNPGGSVVNSQLWTIPFEVESYVALTVASIIGVIRRRSAFLWILIAVTFVASIVVIGWNHADATEHVPGRALVMCFLVGACLFTYADKIPYSNTLGFISVLLSALCLEIPDLCYAAAFPVCYATAWLGLKSLPRIPFGDLSYGVFLFHFPIEQTTVHLLGFVRSWWLLTLISLPLTLALAWLVWTFVEQPILSRKPQILASAERLGRITFRQLISPIYTAMSVRHR